MISGGCTLTPSSDCTKINDTKSQRIKNQLQTRYLTLDKEVKRKTKADKRAFIENLADEAETAAEMQHMATLYKITKALAGGFKKTVTFQ